MSVRRIARVLAAQIVLSPTCTLAAPAPVSLLPIGGYMETYLPNPKVSGSLLVGLQWGGVGGYFDPHDVRLQLPAAVTGGHACVDLASKDGRYVAENLYTVAPAGGQARLDAKTQYESQLSTYPADDVGVVIRAGKTCDDEACSIIPAFVVPLHADAVQSTRRLVADVNADAELVTAGLLGPDGAGIPANTACVAAGAGVQIAYSTVCTIDLQVALPRSGVVLRLQTKERFKTISNDFTLLTP